MALLKGKYQEIPQDAVILSENEALEYQSKILNSWKKSSDIFAFKYGTGVLMGAAILSGVYINNFFRYKFKLLRYGRAASYLPICVIPSSLAFLTHSESVLRNILLMKSENCPICLQLRASAFQSLFGLVMPLAVAPVSTLMLANKYATMPLPSLRYKPLELLKLVQTKVRPIQNILFAIFIGHALLGSAVTYLEAQSIYTVHRKLAKLDANIELLRQ